MFIIRQQPPRRGQSIPQLHGEELRRAVVTVRASHNGVDRDLATLTDCARLARDIVTGMLCGATVGLFVGMLGATF